MECPILGPAAERSFALARTCFSEPNSDNFVVSAKSVKRRRPLLFERLSAVFLIVDVLSGLMMIRNLEYTCSDVDIYSPAASGMFGLSWIGDANTVALPLVLHVTCSRRASISISIQHKSQHNNRRGGDTCSQMQMRVASDKGTDTG